MSNNLTQYLKVVGNEQSGLHPQVGHHLIVLRQIGQGRVFHSMIASGQPPPKQGLLSRVTKSEADLVSIPVTTNTSLRHEFSSPVDHVSPGHAFETRYVLSFAVAAPDVVGTRWREDPVREVEKEIKRALDASARRAEWLDLKRQILADGAARLCRLAVDATLPSLQAFAGDYGLEIRQIDLTLRLSKADAQKETEEAELERKRTSIANDLAKKAEEKSAQHYLNKMDVLNQNELIDLQLPRRLKTAGVDGAIEALKNVAANTTRGSELVQTVREIGSLMGSAGGFAPQAGYGSTATQPAFANVNSGLALGAASESDQKLGTMFLGLTQLVGGFPVDPAQKRELLAYVMHLIAEAYRGEEADVEIGKKYQALAEDLVAGWRSVPGKDHLAMQQFTDFELIRERLR